MTRHNVSVEVALARQHLVTIGAIVGVLDRVAIATATCEHGQLAASGTSQRRRRRRQRGLCVQAHVLVEIGRIAERPQADLALERLVAGVRAQVDLEAVLAVVRLAAEEAHVRLLVLAHFVGHIELDGLRAVEHGDAPVEAATCLLLLAVQHSTHATRLLLLLLCSSCGGGYGRSCQQARHTNAGFGW